MEDELDMNVTSFQHQDIFEDDDDDDDGNDENKQAGDELSDDDENDSLLVRYDINSDVSL